MKKDPSQLNESRSRSDHECEWESFRIIHPTQSLPPPLRTIRRSFELLSVSYFLNIFAPALSIQNFAISKLEADLDGSQPDSYLPILIPKLLVSLTGDRTTNHSNWESRLRREFFRREPQANPLGAEPAKPKPKIFKRAVGYVYIAEAIPLSTLPTVDDLNSQYAQLTKAKSGTSQQAPVGNQTPIDPSQPQHVSESEQTASVLPATEIEQTASALPDTQPLNDTPQLSNTQSPAVELPNPNPVDAKSSGLLPSDSHPSDKPPPEDLIHHAEEPKPLNAPSSESSSPAPQNPAGPSTILWSSLSPTIKLKSLFKLCEWHFSTSTDLDRFRRLVDHKAYNSNIVGLDEHSDWRQERCGIDSKGNQYWLSGQGIECRLWVQRREPQPPLKAITLRIPARSKKKEKNAQTKQPKRKHVSQESPTTPSTPATNRSRRCSSGALPDPKRARLTGTRSSQRLRGTQAESSNRSISPRPPTMIVIKKTGAPQNSKAPKQGVNGSRRRSSRRSANDEVWQDVPPGWLDEVVEPTSKQPSTALSSDLSEMSDDDDYVVNARQSNPKKSKPMAMKAKSMPVATDNASVDESLSELSDSPDPSTVLTSESVSEAPSIAAERVDEIPDVNKTEQRTDDVPKCDDKAVRLPTAEHSCPGQEMEVETAEVVTMSVKDDPDQKPSDIPVSNVRLSELDDCKANNAQLDLPKPAQSIIDPIHEPSAQPVTPEPNAPTKELIPKVECGYDVEKVQPCSDDTDPFFPELKGHPLDPDWIEWEVVCADLNDWQNFYLQFENSESHSEKQLVEFINNEILPEVMASHNEEEARKQKEEAMAQRKRSSRLATREAVQATSMEIDTMTRETRMHSDRLEAKRLKELEQQEESKKQKEEDQRLVRLRERERNIAIREAQQASEREAEVKRAERARLRAESKLLGKAVKVAKAGVENSVPSIDSTEQWELNCEICGVSGRNVDDGSEVISCDKCEIWQHVVCHDRADEIMKKPKQDWPTADFMCANCSGIPIPRAVKKLRTHINGRPKPPPRQRASKAKDELNQSAPATPGPSTAKPKITILMSNPSRQGGSTLNEVSPEMNPASTSAPNPPQLQNAPTQYPPSQLTNSNLSGENTSCRPNGNLANQAPPDLTMSRSTCLSSSVPSYRPAATARTTNVPDLTKYYDDLEKLCCILRTNTNLHRTLPVEVMHRLRRYLLDQQEQQERQRRQREQQQLGRLQPTTSSITPAGSSSLNSNLHPSLNGQSTQPINLPPSFSHDLQQNPRPPHLHSARLVHDSQTIDPQLQQLTARPEPLRTNTITTPDAPTTTPTPTPTPTTSAAVSRHDAEPYESEYGHF
ncbi:hypothetical protein PtB15_5B55 [Puccinia triticina]|nr:hypothetical protein PtB15_5B55 [Puccinia triticina]